MFRSRRLRNSRTSRQSTKNCCRLNFRKRSSDSRILRTARSHHAHPLTVQKDDRLSEPVPIKSEPRSSPMKLETCHGKFTRIWSPSEGPKAKILSKYNWKHHPFLSFAGGLGCLREVYGRVSVSSGKKKYKLINWLIMIAGGMGVMGVLFR